MIIPALVAGLLSTIALLSSSDYETMSLGAKIVWFVMVTPVVMLGGIGLYFTVFHTDIVMKMIGWRQK
ncbi:hypothetical protein [Idiomarina sp.]|uniref:hypothetical protein n=1 Tax=Idiomarina sp. TaxID=1874361 RepID=UPI0025B825F4|nr:hypothetical protein [Idiomarina sp.]